MESIMEGYWARYKETRCVVSKRKISGTHQMIIVLKDWYTEDVRSLDDNPILMKIVPAEEVTVGMHYVVKASINWSPLKVSIDQVEFYADD